MALSGGSDSPRPKPAANQGVRLLGAQLVAMRWNQVFFRGRHAQGSDRPQGAALAEGSSLARPALSVCVASGKGGTGKSVLSASLATLLSARGRTLLVDADFGVGNAHILFDASPARSFVDVAQGHCQVREAVHGCGQSLDLIAGGSGVSRMAGLSLYEMHLVASGLEALEFEYEYLLVDSAAGISDQTVGFALASDVVLIVTTPDLTAMTDAYAFLKVLYARKPDARVSLIVNRCQADPDAPQFGLGEGECPSAEQLATRVAERIVEVSRKFLGCEPHYAGLVPEDRAVARSIAQRMPLVRSEPGSPAALALQARSVALFDEWSRIEPLGLGQSLRRSVAYQALSAS